MNSIKLPNSQSVKVVNVPSQVLDSIKYEPSIGSIVFESSLFEQEEIKTIKSDAAKILILLVNLKLIFCN